MEIIDLIAKVEGSDAFKSWDSKGYFLAHVFKMAEQSGSWQVGYYSVEKDDVVTFNVEKDAIEKNPPSEVFKEPKSKIHKLDTSSVSIDWKEALEKAKDTAHDEYQGQYIMKTFFILQEIDSMPVYNITFLTKAFATINVKLSAKDGSVVKHSLTSLMDMAKVEKGERGKQDKEEGPGEDLQK